MKRRKFTDENIKVGSIAREEMAIERDRILRRKREGHNLFEKAAGKWMKEKKREEEKKKFAREKEAPNISIREVSLEGKAAQEDETIGWKQSKWQEERNGREIGTKNAASIRVFAKKLMAREWAKALGKKIEDPCLSALEDEARNWKEKKEGEEKKIKEAAEARREALREKARQKKLLREKQEKEEERKIKEEEARREALREKARQKKLLREKQKEEKARRLRAANWEKTTKQIWDKKISEWVKKKIKK